MRRAARYLLLDSENQVVYHPFVTRKQADDYRILMGRRDWKITRISKPSTPRQRAAVTFCEHCLEGISFEGDINDFFDVSDFLSLYLDSAKSVYEDAAASYYSFIADKDWA